MTIIGMEYEKELDSYNVFFRTNDGYKEYFTIHSGFKVRDAYNMFAPKMSWEEYLNLPEKV